MFSFLLFWLHKSWSTADRIRDAFPGHRRAESSPCPAFAAHLINFKILPARKTWCQPDLRNGGNYDTIIPYTYSAVIYILQQGTKSNLTYAGYFHSFKPCFVVKVVRAFNFGFLKERVFLESAWFSFLSYLTFHLYAHFCIANARSEDERIKSNL